MHAKLQVCRSNSSRDLVMNSDDDIRLIESDYEESKESADEIDHIPVNPDIYVAMAQNGYRIIVMFLVDLRLEMCFATKQWSNKLREK
ncbi:hypothetical protein TNCV_3019301 [Trichonephila clavipes]|nr:hypothetical protein TNCV_3019301 [Trichonephila clavipes]